MTTNPALTLSGFTFEELFTAKGLARLDDQFLTELHQYDANLSQTFLAYRNQTVKMDALAESELLIQCAKFLEMFLAKLFNIQEALAISQIETTSLNPISVFKKYFVLRRAKKELNRSQSLPDFKELEDWLNQQLTKAPIKTSDRELAVSLLGVSYLTNPDHYQAEIEKLVQWCTRVLLTIEAQEKVADWVSFRLPKRLDFNSLVPTEKLNDDPFNRLSAPAPDLRLRDGFKLTDPRMNAREIQDEINYCIYCHDHEGDFCSKGFPVKKGDPLQGFKKNPLDITLTGCPLEEKISEMHLLKKEGHTIGALSVIMIDNPMCPATGHRICNDCMKACIYQKQDPVNIPQIETRVLTDVLNLPWGVELYDLLTRWNPLRQQQWQMKPYNGLKIMIAGMGPAGFTLAHHLLLEGFAVVGFDGLKIEALPTHFIHSPIYHFNSLKEELDERLMAGFGGVAEYGITVRWDKNFLKLIYLSLLRKPYFQVFGGVRFGGTIKVEDAWDMGFDHFVVAVGAGLPKALAIENSLNVGMRQANDFLMALQLGSAAKSSSLTNLQIRLPAIVIGGGLTGVDTATEIQAYYIAQVEKIASRYHKLVKKYGEQVILSKLDYLSSQTILFEYLKHAEAISEERALARKERRKPNFIKLIREWGGVTIAYRRSMKESPAYINNHEELQKALQEGIFYLEGLEPRAVELDEFGHTQALICFERQSHPETDWVTTSIEKRLPAKSILVATGTQPNTAYEFEHRGTFNRLNLQYQHYEDENGELNVAHGVSHCKDPQFGPFTSYQKDQRRVSLIGDTHPVFHGSVVKAIASGMRTFPKIMDVLKDKLGQLGQESEYRHFAEHMQACFEARLLSISRKAHSIIELVVKAPIAAKHFKPGQFYRLQNFENNAPSLDGTQLQMEPLALQVAQADEKNQTLTFVVLENTVAGKLCSILKPNECLSLMGPTGIRAKIPGEHETILIVGQTQSLAFVRSYGKMLRDAGNRVLFFGEFDHPKEFYCEQEMKAATDFIKVSTGNEDIFTLLFKYGKELAPATPLGDVDRIYVVGNANFLHRFQTAVKEGLQTLLLKSPKVFGSVYGNMQCMLKGVCAQCLQWQIDPETGQRTKAVFACSWQDQPLEIIDIDHINSRIHQNATHEKINSLWLDYLFENHPIERI